MRHALPILGVLLVSVALVTVFAWVRAGQDRFEALEREGIGIAQVVRSAVEESEALLATAERYLAERLEAVARRLDAELERIHGPASDLLQDVAEEERIGRIFLLDGDLEPIARVQTPRPVSGGPGSLLTPEDKAQLEWEEARRTAAHLTTEPGRGVVEGMRDNVYGTRVRFGIAYGRRSGGVLLLRANADEISRLEERFGLATRLERIAVLPQVRNVRIVSAEGRDLLAVGPEARAPAPAAGEAIGPWEARVSLGPDALRILLPATPDAKELIDLSLDRTRADRAIARSRRAILVGGLVALGIAAAALLLVVFIERGHRSEQVRAAARLEEERKFAELGALAGLVTHEVGNPLNTMRFAMQLLTEEKDPAQRALLLQSMRESVDRIAASAQGLLRSTAGHHSSPRPVDASLLANVKHRVRESAERLGVALDVVAESRRPAWVDPLVTEEALVNLVRNAVGASPEGGRVRLLWADADAGGVRIAITDEGPGFPPDRDMLLRLGRPNAREGHGLGLPLARRFLEAQGGRILLGDAEGGGARVEVTLPSVDEERAS